MTSGRSFLDLQGLKCPLPALLLTRALKRAAAGDLIDAVATDPLAEIDLVFAAQQSGAEVLSITRVGDTLRFAFRARQEKAAPETTGSDVQ